MKKPIKSKSYADGKDQEQKNHSLRETSETEISPSQHQQIKDKLFRLHEELLRKLAQ